MKQLFLLFLFNGLCFFGFSQKIEIVLDAKSPQPSLLAKGTFKVMLVNDTNESISLFFSHHKQYGGSILTWKKMKDGKEVKSGNWYKPMDTNSRFDKRAIVTVAAGAKRHISTMTLDAQEAGIHTLAFSIDQDPATVNLSYAKDGTTKAAAANLTKMKIETSIDFDIKPIEKKAFEKRTLTYEELKKEKFQKDFKMATVDPSSAFAMEMVIAKPEEAADKFAKLAELKNLGKLSIVVKTSQEITIPAAISDLDLKILNIRGDGRIVNATFNFPENFLSSNNLAAVQLSKLRNTNLDFLQNHTQLKFLKLSNIGWETLPAWIGNFTELENLEISSDPIQALPKELEKLTQLQNVRINRTKISSINELQNNIEMTRLNVKQNELTSLPETIGNLTALTDIYASQNKLTTIPASIGNLKQVNKLFLSRNNLTSLPEEIGELTEITVLTIDYNQLKKLPNSIGNFKKMKNLDIQHNKLSNLPTSIKGMIAVDYLILNNNEFKTLPSVITKMPKLTKINFENNQITELPEEFFGMKLYRIYSQGNDLNKKQKKRMAKVFERKVKS